jgi:hypothetical protein
MLFSDQKNFLYIHIPKTAGSSLKLALKPYESTQPIAFVNDPELLDFIHNRSERLKNRGMTFPNHMRIRDVQRQMSVNLSKLTVFAMIRNPWERMQSLYDHYRRDPQHPYCEVANKLDLNHFVKFLMQVRQTQPYIDALPQMDYLTGKDGLIEVDYILKYEKMDQALSLLNKELQLMLTITRANAAPEHYRYAMDKETQTLIHEYEKGIIGLAQYFYDKSIDPMISVIKVEKIDSTNRLTYL